MADTNSSRLIVTLIDVHELHEQRPPAELVAWFKRNPKKPPEYHAIVGALATDGLRAAVRWMLDSYGATDSLLHLPELKTPHSFAYPGSLRVDGVLEVQGDLDIGYMLEAAKIDVRGDIFVGSNVKSLSTLRAGGRISAFAGMVEAEEPIIATKIEAGICVREGKHRRKAPHDAYFKIVGGTDYRKPP